METVRFSREHVAEAAEIERLCFSEPWSEDSLVMLADGGYGAGVACVEQERLVAYAGMVSVLDEGEIVNVATHPDFRRRGYARAALRELFRIAGERGVTVLTLEVRASNSAARALYESEGFEAVGTRPGFYSHPREDAIIMTRKKED
ncbi:MAG: ribosomal protein S18-alanine N-acetyltransferase [Clostridia bacterium]|nr:ribosomal protein S18-alanine N-acetyltransferase [Clostridia bacterium]